MSGCGGGGSDTGMDLYSTIETIQTISSQTKHSLTTNEKFGSFSFLIIRVMKGNNLKMQMKYK